MFFFFADRQKFTVAEMEEMEKNLRNSELYSCNLSADDSQLSVKLNLKVEYVTDMADDNEAELLPIDDDKYNGLIRLRKELEKNKFAYIHEIIHYIFDVGYGKKVTKPFARKRKGKTNSREEQRTNYMTAAYIMPLEQIVNFLQEYDYSIPKTDELKFVRDLQKEYEQNEVTVVRRIREVRRITKYGKSKDLVS